MHVQSRPAGMLKTDKRDALTLANQLYSQFFGDLGEVPSVAERTWDEEHSRTTASYFIVEGCTVHLNPPFFDGLCGGTSVHLLIHCLLLMMSLLLDIELFSMAQF
jgi:hypothetical protein